MYYKTTTNVTFCCQEMSSKKKKFKTFSEQAKEFGEIVKHLNICFN